MAKTRFFRVAVEGATTDGRQIDRKWLEEMASTYNRDTYAARVNMEHIRGITADKPFKSYGDVLSLKTEEIELDLAGKKQKRLALFAELDVTDELVAINKDRQKLYSSVEINPSFADTGKAYLVGLAVTDSPASLGTEMLQFRTRLEGNSPMKLDATHLFTPAEEAAIELAEEAPANPDPTGIFASIKGMLDKFTGGQQQSQEAPAKEPAAPPAQAEAGALAAFGVAIGHIAASVDKFATESAAQIAALTAKVGTIEQTLEKAPAPDFRQRPPATGGGANEVRTDC